jgi:hypothetical protein
MFQENARYQEVDVSRDSVIGIASSYGLDDQEFGVLVPVGLRIFSSPSRSGRLWGPPNFLSNRYRGICSTGVKRQRPETDHSPPTSTVVKKMWTYTPIPPYLSTGINLPWSRSRPSNGNWWIIVSLGYILQSHLFLIRMKLKPVDVILRKANTHHDYW